MKLHSSRAEATRNRGREAFTMIEMIGVLAVIAILAAMLVPRVFQAVDSARVNATAVTCEGLKAAAIDHYGRYGKLISFFGTNDLALPINNYDRQVLMPEGLLEKPFSARIAGGDPSTNSAVQLLTANTAGPSANGFNLDGGTTPINQNAQVVLQAVCYGVALADARDLNDRVDGTSLGTNTPPDLVGRITYTAPNANGLVTVYVYLTHR
jgi:prepilin-type N-terminal cleavage/methylation domain-containing protein